MLKIMANLDGSPEYVHSVDWFGLLSKTKEELEAKKPRIGQKEEECDALKKIMEKEKR